jgi:hypothetical protein
VLQSSTPQAGCRVRVGRASAGESPEIHIHPTYLLTPYLSVTDDTLNRYSTPFADHFARSIRSICTPSTRVAFVCSPTCYVAFQGLPQPLSRTLLFEYDDRFAVLPVTTGNGEERRGFIQYDLYEPERIPKDLEGSVDVVVVDPPYLNEVSSPYRSTSFQLTPLPLENQRPHRLHTPTNTRTVRQAHPINIHLGPIRSTVASLYNATTGPPQGRQGSRGQASWREVQGEWVVGWCTCRISN